MSKRVPIGLVLVLVFACAGGEDFGPQPGPDGGETTWECYGANDCQPGGRHSA